MELMEALRVYTSHKEFRPGQKRTISSVLGGKHTISMLPTGTGKSLCYQLPGYMRKGSVLIVSPLLSLMHDQVEQLRAAGEKRAVALNSFLPLEEKNRAMASLEGYKFIFISPEMLGIPMVTARMKELEIALFVVDEAHCISQWGYDFRPDYARLGDVRENLGNPITLALTATATSEVRADIARQLHLDDWEEIVYSIDRPAIAISVEQVGRDKKLSRVIELAESLEGPGIIYFSSKRKAEEIAILLRQHGMNAMSYHGGLEQENRILIQQQFVKGQLDIICATSAFGMGINKQDVRFILHYHMPLDIESYVQEIGRAGRDNGKSIAILLYSPGDEQLSFGLAALELPDDIQISSFFSLAKEIGMKPGDCKTYEKQLVPSAGLTEIQWRLLCDFLLRWKQEKMGAIEEKFSLYVEQRRKVKSNKIKDMLAFISAESCKRVFLLKFFGENADISKETCCSSCGFSYLSFVKKIKNSSRNYHVTWQEELASLLLRR
ncbi:RecQ family ATP-dependent DNA helicase [Bacillus massilinigeriensis]|uniref:RecQ family ATP-dependent DNA helicase n=1 Tax=Bacillus mediterraneensis TaxID=1805474 RepID=UPI0008F94813|nr:ATP-dependent DNA helicase RecQ [Bacillus mediterraneensis]